MSGRGCIFCGFKLISDTKISNFNSFCEKAKKIHGEEYDYSKVQYSGNNKKVIIVCKKHGEFLQTPNSHLNGKSCPICKESKGEKKIAKILTELNIDFEKQKKFEDCKNVRSLPFDFYIKNTNTAIEFQGRQHYEEVKAFGGENQLVKTQINDKIKEAYCLTKNIKLVTIKYNENIEEILNEALA